MLKQSLIMISVTTVLFDHDKNNDVVADDDDIIDEGEEQG